MNTAADVCGNHFPGKIEYLTFYLKDTKSEDASCLFSRTIEWVQDSIGKGGRVLVPCREGVSRSSTMVIVYLMWLRRFSFVQAFDHVRRAPQICTPNTGFTCQLLVLGKRLGIIASTNSGLLDAVNIYRAAPHNPRNPLLVLSQVEFKPGHKPLDPRFGFLVQKVAELIG